MLICAEYFEYSDQHFHCYDNMTNLQSTQDSPDFDIQSLIAT